MNSRYEIITQLGTYYADEIDYGYSGIRFTALAKMIQTGQGNGFLPLVPTVIATSNYTVVEMPITTQSSEQK